MNNEDQFFETERDLLIRHFFNQGYTNKEITASLFHCNDIILSVRQLKRDLQRLNLSRRKNRDHVNVVQEALQNEIDGRGCNLGYRMMYQRISKIYRVKTTRDTVYTLMKQIDPEGIQRRSAKRLRRRIYTCKGPNYTWHLDGYDKLKPYGFCIHGCMDGFSRKILWLEVASTNNDPSVIASYFIKYVNSIKGTARKIRGDLGTENLNVAAVQRFFRDNHDDDFAGEKSFLFGKSTSNQRIEAYWSKLRQSTTQFWMDFFADMREEGSLREDDESYRTCLRYCFMPLIQKHLDETRVLHNTHRIRRQPNQICPSGKPNVIYTMPSEYDAQDYKTLVSDDDISISYENTCCEKLPFGCSEDYGKVFQELMMINMWQQPTNEIEAKNLYSNMCEEISVLL